MLFELFELRGWHEAEFAEGTYEGGGAVAACVRKEGEGSEVGIMGVYTFEGGKY